MDLAELTVEPDEVEAKLAEYEAVLAGQRTAEDTALLAGYRAARRGHAVISLPRTIAAGGFFPSGLPRLAVARGNAAECYAWWEPNSLLYTTDPLAGNRGALVGQRSVRVPLAGGELPQRRPGNWNSARGRALVPLVPPACRLARPRLQACHILWEVEEWEMVAPVDPALIRHLLGDLWEVLSMWNLTELERSVLSQRALAASR